MNAVGTEWVMPGLPRMKFYEQLKFYCQLS